MRFVCLGPVLVRLHFAVAVVVPVCLPLGLVSAPGAWGAWAVRGGGGPLRGLEFCLFYCRLVSQGSRLLACRVAGRVLSPT